MITPTITAIGVCFPDEVRTNDWWDVRYPNVVANAREAVLARVWAEHGAGSLYDRCIEPYLDDPFRGTVERRWMRPEQGARTLEMGAARAAIRARGCEVGEIDHVLVNALRSDSIEVGDAAYLLAELGVRAPGINIESACSSALVGLDMACNMVALGRCKCVMVVVCSTYTRDVDPSDSFSWFLGDGAAAFLVEPATRAGEGVLGRHTVATQETCGIFSYELTSQPDGQPSIRLKARRDAGKVIRDMSETYLRAAVDGALTEARMTMAEVDFLVVNTPTAWYAEFCAAALGVPRERTIDNYPRFANCGPALWPSNLHTAISEGRVRPGDVVLGYSIGSVATASAVVLRIGDIALGNEELQGARHDR
jgi:3-oxoacyl-[acyl-carrier-protein] synthase-3